MVKNNIPANNFGSLLELQKVNGVQSLKTEEIYTHHSCVTDGVVPSGCHNKGNKRES